MKVHVVNKNEESITGYQRVEISGGIADFQGCSDNECTSILMTTSLDSVDLNGVQKLLHQARQKMRIGGSLVVGGTDIRLLSRAVVSGSLDTQQANEVLYSKSSCSDVNTVVDLLRSLGLSVISTKVAGIHYEIESVRKA
tara:strand:+ start:305 stop:724 length:420 start_codon:yes stop_codon:yes gene_type:complete